MNAANRSDIDRVVSLLFLVGLIALLPLNLLPALLSGLLVYALVAVMVPGLNAVVALHGEGPRLLSVTLLAAVAIAIIVLAGFGVAAFFRHGDETLPALVTRMAEILDAARDDLPRWMLRYFPEDAEALRLALVEWLRENTGSFQIAGAELGRALTHIILGMVIGALLSLESAVPSAGEAPLNRVIRDRGTRLAEAFRRVVFAQFQISAFNTLLTGVYLVVVLPLLGIELPFAKTLIAITFIAGLLPILGNLISNTIIFIVSLSQGVWVAVGSLTYLVVIHKLEYFLNARIIGGQIRARAWELLIVMLVMEAAFGIAGLVAAPIYYAYVKSELKAWGYLANPASNGG